MAKPQASHLKAEGNKLVAAGDHVRAASKYTEAIALDGKNAILFANRAACYLASKRLALPRSRRCYISYYWFRRYHDAVNDASKVRILFALYRTLRAIVTQAVEIDPVYVKGWTRLAASKDVNVNDSTCVLRS
jgi:hypothetical protein